MKTLSFMFTLLSVLLTGCNDNENTIGDSILTFYLELTDENGNPVITSDEEAGAFPKLTTVPISPNNSFSNFEASRAKKGANGHYYFEVTNHSAMGDEYRFILHARGEISSDYTFETTWSNVNLKSIKVNGNEITPGKVSFNGKEYASISLAVVH